MSRLIKLHEIDEFSKVKNIPDGAISEEILLNIKNLDEKKEIEPFIREILYDPNETPHGPAEIADILTSHVHVRGEKRLAAFVLKGKSFQKVTSRGVTHQFAKLRQIPSLGLMIFLAVGSIQDDAQRDFIRNAIDAGSDYLIIDVQDCARLLIAYEKICPKDGTAYDESGTCQQGHQLDDGLPLEMEVRERARYTIVKQRDLSHAGAKRYSATILIDPHYTREVIRTIIREATEKLKYSNYYRNERLKACWGETPAHVIWFFIACDSEDIQDVNWVCRSSWIDPSLPEGRRPFGLNGNEKLGDIEILWNDEYKPYKDFFESLRGTKEQVLDAINPILEEMVTLAKRAIMHFDEYRRGELSESGFISKMQEMEPKVTELYRKAGNIPEPPVEGKEYNQACQNIFATVSDMFLYYSKKGLETWSKQNRISLMLGSVRRFYSDLERIKFEESKLH
jgi:hypothetical protein